MTKLVLTRGGQFRGDLFIIKIIETYRKRLVWDLQNVVNLEGVPFLTSSSVFFVRSLHPLYLSFTGC